MTASAKPHALSRDTLGRLVRAVWVANRARFIVTGAAVPAHHLASYDELPYDQKVVDGEIGVAVALAVFETLAARVEHEPELLGLLQQVLADFDPPLSAP